MAPRRESTRPSRSDAGDDLTERLVAAIRDAPRPVVNTGYLVRQLDRPAADLRPELDALVEAGVLDHHEVRGRGHLWWLTLDAELEG
ncbi:hypothetical protein [Halomarina rubra]|uniref:Uncharacterized protein n=1 Tax=Halomarina rubra TaxID=2071873 RepID=A0ABD6AQ46_9EURY|nr:hypothetical protein [Halomarina rubra]